MQDDNRQAYRTQADSKALKLVLKFCSRLNIKKVL